MPTTMSASMTSAAVRGSFRLRGMATAFAVGVFRAMTAVPVILFAVAVVLLFCFAIVAMTVVSLGFAVAMIVRLGGMLVLHAGLHVGRGRNEHIGQDAFGQNDDGDERRDKDRLDHGTAIACRKKRTFVDTCKLRSQAGGALY